MADLGLALNQLIAPRLREPSMDRDDSPKENWSAVSRRRREGVPGMQKSIDAHNALSNSILFMSYSGKQHKSQ